MDDARVKQLLDGALPTYAEPRQDEPAAPKGLSAAQLKLLDDAAPDTTSTGLLRQFGAAAGNVATGAVKGMDDLFYGPIVQIVKHVDPDLAKRLYDVVNKATPITEMDPSAPLDYTVGKILGQTGAMAAGGGLVARGAGAVLGAGAGEVAPGLAETATGSLAKQAPEAASAISRIAGNAATGGAIGAAEMKDPEEQGNRVADMLSGALFGSFGGEFGNAAGTIGARIANSSAAKKLFQELGADKYIQAAKDGVEAVGEAPQRLKAGIDNAYQSVSREKSRLYAVRDQAGKGAAPISSANLTTALNDYGKELENSSVSPRVMPILDRVRETLSTEEGSGVALLPAGIKMDPNTPQGAINLARMREAGIKVLPDEIQPNALFSALTDVNKEMRGSKDPAKVAQLRGLKDIIMGEVRNVSAQTGKSPDALLKAHEDANEYFKENVVPFRKYFGIDPNEANATSKLTSKQTTDKVMTTLESKDPEQIAPLMKMITGNSPQNARDISKLMMQRAMAHGVNTKGEFSPGRMVQYFKENQAAVDHLPFETQQQIAGFGKLIKAGEKHIHIPGSHATASMLMFIGAEHAVRGDLTHAGMMVGSGVGAMMMFRGFAKLIDNSKGRMFLSAANKLPEGSPRLLQLLQRAAPLVGRTAGANILAGNPPPDQGGIRAMPVPAGQGGLTLQQMIGLGPQ